MGGKPIRMKQCKDDPAGPGPESQPFYHGRILKGGFAPDLTRHVRSAISGCRALEESGFPALSYLCAWYEGQGTIWYEYVSHRLAALFGCPPEQTAEFIRSHILERREYRYLENGEQIDRTATDRRELVRTKSSLREQVSQSGHVEAVYKIALGKSGGGERRVVWLKDQALITPFPEDRISLSFGTLTVVTKEMELEEDLKEAREALERYKDHLEVLVEERNRELIATNERLREEITEREQARATLQVQSQHLEEVNTALRVLLKQREEDKYALEETVVSNVKELIRPYLDRLNKSGLKSNQQALTAILEANLHHIVSPFIKRISSQILHLTPMEIKVAGLVKDGKTNQEIADLLFLSKNTVLVHRHHIRTKMGLKNKKSNLRSHLLTLNE